MKQFDLQGNEYDIQIRDMIDPIENWQYVSGTRDIGKSYFQNLLDEKDKEIERLHSIIKEVREYITSQELHKIADTTGGLTYKEYKLLEILDKGSDKDDN